MNSNEPIMKRRSAGVRAMALHVAIAMLVLASNVLAPLAALAQDAVPGNTIPDAAAAQTETTTETTVLIDEALPSAPNGYSGGALDEDASGEVVIAIESNATELESLVTVDSSSTAVQAIYGPLGAELSNPNYLPLMQFDHNINRMPKLGFGAGRAAITAYQDIRKLNAGWYVNWTVSLNPPRPGMEFVQMVRLHQNLDETKVYNPNTGQMCGNGVTADRTICPYATPASYTYSPSRTTIERAARANPGSIWLIGNEMERYDWNGGRQDEIVPELYAYAFRELRAIIKAADPTARIAVGGVIQFTPLRQQWLDRVWARYSQIAGGRTMDQDVDVFNIHNFIGSERCEILPNGGINNRSEMTCTGMGIPAGVPPIQQIGNAQLGSYVGQDNRHMDMATFAEQIVGFRTWMKSKNANNVNKPLIVTEYGALYSTLCNNSGVDRGRYVGTQWRTDRGNGIDDGFEQCQFFYVHNPMAQPWGWVDFTNPQVVQNFMIQSFDYFNTAADCNLVSQSGLDCKLVQRWAWFGLEEIGWGFNSHGALVNLDTGVLTPTGQLFAEWGRTH